MLYSLGLTGLLLAACFTDLKAFRIPNIIPLGLIALFLIKMAAVQELDSLPGHLAAFAFTLLLGFLAFALRVLGGGDAKLLAALALWFGMASLPSLLALTAMGGGVLALSLLLIRRIVALRQAVVMPTGAEPSGARSKLRWLDPRAPVPYALPIAVAAVCLEWL